MLVFAAQEWTEPKVCLVILNAEASSVSSRLRFLSSWDRYLTEDGDLPPLSENIQVPRGLCVDPESGAYCWLEGPLILGCGFKQDMAELLMKGLYLCHSGH